MKELPYFEELYKEHGDDIAVVAVHYKDIVEDDPKEFVKSKGLDLPFALDDQAQTVWKAVGGTESLPQTIVLDRNGVVIYNRRKPVDKALLDSLYEEASIST